VRGDSDGEYGEAPEAETTEVVGCRSGVGGKEETEATGKRTGGRIEASAINGCDSGADESVGKGPRTKTVGAAGGAKDEMGVVDAMVGAGRGDNTAINGREGSEGWA
jgi:hypothetical protein